MAKITRLNVMLSASTRGLSNGIARAQDKLDSLTGTARRAQGALGRAFANPQIAQGARAIAAGAASLTSMAGPAAVALTALGVGAGLAGRALGRLAKQQIDAVGDTVDFAKSVGLSYNRLRALQFAAKLAGIEGENLNKAFEKMTDVLGSAADGNQAALASLERIGLTFEQIQAMRPEQRFEAIAAAINRIQDPAERLAAARDIFGKQGGALTNLFGGVGEAIATATKRLEQFGITLSAFDQSNIEKAGDTFDVLGLAIEGIGNRLAAEVSPYIIQAGKDLEKWLDTIGGVNGLLDRTVDYFKRLVDWADKIPKLLNLNPVVSAAIGAVTGEGGIGGAADSVQDWANKARRSAAEEFDAEQQQRAKDDRAARQKARREARFEGLRQIESYQTPQLSGVMGAAPGARQNMSGQGLEELVQLTRQVVANTGRANLAYMS